MRRLIKIADETNCDDEEEERPNKTPLPTGFSSTVSPQPLRFRPAAGLDVSLKKMNQDDTVSLESEFGIHFPSAYRHAITDSYPFRNVTEELDTDPTSLRTSNAECRSTDPWGFPWKSEYWRIGGDGAGGFYFIDTSKDDSTVYYCDHEDMPESMDDEERLSVNPFPEFIQGVLDLKEHMKQWEEEMKNRVASRRWWQFWIPRQWPPPRRG